MLKELREWRRLAEGPGEELEVTIRKWRTHLPFGTVPPPPSPWEWHVRHRWICDHLVPQVRI